MSSSTPLRRPFTDITNLLRGNDRINDTGIITPDSSPAKKPRIHRDEPERTPTVPDYAGRQLAKEFGGHFARKAEKYDFVEFLDKSKKFMSKRNAFYDCSLSLENPTPYSMNCHSSSGNVIVGTEDGHLLTLKSSEDQNPMEICEIAKDKAFGSAVTDIDLCQNMIACASREKFMIKDFSSGSDPRYYDIGIGSIKQIRFDPQNPSIVLTSSRIGEIALRDLRTPTSFYVFNRAHDIKSREKSSSRRNVSITAMEWIDNYKIVTGCEANIGLKLWDIRKIYKGTTRTGMLDSSPVKIINGSGVTSIAIDRMNRKIWAMSLDSKIRSYNFDNLASGAQNTLTSPSLNIKSFYTKLDILEDTSGSILACGGSKGPVLFPLARSFYAPPPGHSIEIQHGHSSSITCITSDPLSQIMYTASDDGVVREWSQNPGVYHQLTDPDTDKRELSNWCWAEKF